jgi:hypothetical protein
MKEAVQSWTARVTGRGNTTESRTQIKTAK